MLACSALIQRLNVQFVAVVMHTERCTVERGRERISGAVSVLTRFVYSPTNTVNGKRRMTAESLIYICVRRLTVLSTCFFDALFSSDDAIVCLRFHHALPCAWISPIQCLSTLNLFPNLFIDALLLVIVSAAADFRRG